MPTPAAGLVVRFEADTVKLIRETQKAQDEVKKLVAKLQSEQKKVATSFDKGAAAARNQTRAIKEQTAVVNKNRQSFLRLGQAIAAVYVVKSVASMAADLLNAADAVRLLQSRINAVTGSVRGFSDVVDIARRLGSGVEDTGKLFTKLAVGTKELGATTQELARVTEAVLQLGRVSGLTFAEVNYFSRQLAQGLGSGNFAGDELRSVRENMPIVAQQLAYALTELEAFGKGVVVTAGDLKALGKQGKLTSDVMWRALKFLADSGVAEEMFDQLPDTFEQATNRILDQWKLMIESMSRAFEAAGLYSKIADFSGIFENARKTFNLAGWQGLGEVAGSHFLAGFVGRLENFFAMADPLGIDEFLEKMGFDKWVGTPQTFFRQLKESILEGAKLDPEDIKPESVNWAGYYGVDEAQEAAYTLLKIRGEVQAEIDKIQSKEGSRFPQIDTQRLRDLQMQLDTINAALDKGREKINLLYALAEPTKPRAPRADEKKTKGSMIDPAKEFDRAYKEATAGLGNWEEMIASLDPKVRQAGWAEWEAEWLKRRGQEWEEYYTEVEAYTKANSAAMEGFARAAAQNMQNSFADFLFDPFEDGLKGMLRSFIDVIRRMIAEMLAFQIFQSIGIYALFGIPAPVAPAMPSLPARASGGPVSRGRAYLVGEQGPEVLIPSISGNIVPSHSLGAMSSAGTGEMIVVNQNIDARGNNNPSELLALMPRFADAIKRDIRDSQRRGL